MTPRTVNPDARARPAGGAAYGEDLARVHHLGFGSHAALCAPGIIELLAPVRRRGGLVVELGCGSGALTRRLVDEGHQVIATDASPAMLALTREHVPGAQEVRRLVLPDDPLPAADAIVSVGHVLNYLPDEPAIGRALSAAAAALRPGGWLIVDLCDLEYGRLREQAPPYVRVEPDWTIITRFAAAAPGRFVRDITTFVRDAAGYWRRSDERHVNVLVDAEQVVRQLDDRGVSAAIRPAFGGERLAPGLVAIVGQRIA